MNKAFALSTTSVGSPLVIGLYCTIFVLLFSFTLSSSMAPYIASELGANADISSYTVTFFGLGGAVGVPLGKPLSHRLGVCKFFTLCLLLFILCSWACSAAPNFPLFNLARFFQGFVSGPVYILIVYVTRMIPQAQRLTFTVISISLYTMVPVMANAWGGWIAYDYDWTWGFFVETILLLFLTPFMWAQLRKFQFPQEKNPFDGIGYLFYSISILCIGIIITMGQELDWQRSPLLIALAIIGVPCFIFFLLWDWHHPYPILKLRLLQHKTFCFCLFNLGSLFGAYFATIVLIAQWLIFDVTYTPIWTGFLLIMTASTGAFPWLAIRSEFKALAFLDTRMSLTIAILLLAFSCFLSMFFNEFVNFGRIAFSRLIAGLGIAFFLPPLFRLAFGTFPEEERFDVMTFFQVVRALSSGLGVAFYTTLWQRRKVFFHERLGGDVTPFSEPTKQFFTDAEGFQLQGKHALAQLNDFLDKRSAALGLEDVFYFMSLALSALLVIIALTFLFRMRGFVPEKLQEADKK